MKKFRYKNILLYSSHQWCGNTKEYFIKNSEKIAVFLLMPRVQTKDNILRIYERGKLILEESTPLSENFFLYYALWYYHYIKAIFKYFPRREKLIVISAHPYVFFAMSIQMLLRNIDFVYWIADYYPPINLTMKLYEWLKKFYHNGMRYRIYLGDGVNKIMNGRVVNTQVSKTILWGVRPKNIRRDPKKIFKSILFVGVIRPNVGLEIAYDFLRIHKEFTLKVIGICDENTYKEHMQIVKKYNIRERVYFPNRFFFDEELNEISKECFAGIALYEIDNMSTIYYADPGKVKAYTEMGLPVIMSKTSSIAPYIQECQAGELVDRNPASLWAAIGKIKNNYAKYLKGVGKLNRAFDHETYYREKFLFLEDVFRS